MNTGTDISAAVAQWFADLDNLERSGATVGDIYRKAVGILPLFTDSPANDTVRAMPVEVFLRLKALGLTAGDHRHLAIDAPLTGTVGGYAITGGPQAGFVVEWANVERAVTPADLANEAALLDAIEPWTRNWFDGDPDDQRVFHGGVLWFRDLPLEVLRSASKSHPQYIEPHGYNGRPTVLAVLDSCTDGTVTGYVTSCTRVDLAIRIVEAALDFPGAETAAKFLAEHPPAEYGNGPLDNSYVIGWD